MVDWKSPEVETLCLSLYEKMVLFLLGAFSWFLLQSWNVVEGALFTRRIKLVPAHFPYLFARYGQLVTFILICLMLYLPTPVITSCKATNLVRASSVVGNITLVAASVNLGLRAFTLWKDCRIMRMTILLCCFGHFVYAVLMGSMSVRAVWQALNTVCILVSDSYDKAIAGFYIYTMALDSLILLLTILGLRKARRNIVPSKDSLLSILTAQSVGYAVIIWLTTIPMAVCVLLNLNVIMNIFLSTPGSTISVIASCEMVLALLKLKEEKNGGRTVPANSRTYPNQLTTNINLTDYNRNSDDVASISLASRKDIERVLTSPSHSDLVA
ncbi:hypothetical protein BC835DRAFT_143835 [Cytidiella melzeri]|nr:hypothetical protein BC835DRAFT_143835 [Cytidiella melzeri]